MGACGSKAPEVKEAPDVKYSPEGNGVKGRPSGTGWSAASSFKQPEVPEEPSGSVKVDFTAGDDAEDVEKRQSLGTRWSRGASFQSEVGLPKELQGACRAPG